MISLYRTQIGLADGLDVTVKSATGPARLLAPTWQMVMDYKKERIDADEYEHLYIDHITPISDAVLAHICASAKAGAVCFLCYCPDGEFCHTHLLINYLVERYPERFCDGRVAFSSRQQPKG